MGHRPPSRVLIGKLAKIALVIAAGAVALTAVGFDLTALTVFSGRPRRNWFRPTEVVENFVSGVIILLDKSVKPGERYGMPSGRPASASPTRIAS